MLKEYFRDFNPNVVMLVETRISGLKAKSVVKSIRMPNSHRVEARGFSGGIWILWKSEVLVDVEINDFKFVHL